MSIKVGTIVERGSSSRVLFALDDAVSVNLTDLLKNNDFKNDLNSYFGLVKAVGLLCHQWEVCVGILCMQPINTSLEEANNRMVLHIRDAMILRIKHEILVRTVDSDVIIILLGFVPPVFTL